MDLSESVCDSSYLIKAAQYYVISCKSYSFILIYMIAFFLFTPYSDNTTARYVLRISHYFVFVVFMALLLGSLKCIIRASYATLLCHRSILKVLY